MVKINQVDVFTAFSTHFKTSKIQQYLFGLHLAPVHPPGDAITTFAFGKKILNFFGKKRPPATYLWPESVKQSKEAYLVETSLPLDLWNSLKQTYENVAHLPFPIYASRYEDGQFLLANAQAREFFGFKAADDLSAYQVRTFYENESERARVLETIRTTPAGEWSQRVRVRLTIGGKLRRIHFISQVFSGENGQPLALLCMALNVADSEWFSDFEEDAREGLFEAAALRITDCNTAFAEMLGYSRKDLQNLPIGELFWSKGALDDLISLIKGQKTLRQYNIKLRRRNGAMLIAQLSCDGQFNEAGELTRVSGLIYDVVSETVQNDLPVGIFLISTNDSGEDIIAYASDAYAQVLGYDKAEDVLTRPIREFHPSEASYKAFKDALNREAAKGKPLLDHYMDVRDRFGNKRSVVVNVRYVDGEARRIRVGAIYELTGHINEQLRVLKNNFGAILHTYLSTVTSLRRTLHDIIKAQGEDLLRPNSRLDYELARAEMAGGVKRLQARLDELHRVAAERGYGEEDAFERLRHNLKKINTFGASQEREKDNAAVFRQLLLQMRRNLRPVGELNLPREPVRNLRIEIEDMLRLANTVSLAAAFDELGERIPDFEYFRDFLRGQPPREEDFEVLNLTDIALDVCRALGEFAALRGVDIRTEFNRRERIPVRAHKALLNRALHSLLHNAIKYSWSKGEERRPWVTMRIEKQREGHVAITIENWGVPIRKEELENGAIFEFGTRGKESDDRNRSGTGIGLYDANDIIQRHHGTLKLTSEPTFGNPPNVYSNPFITRVYITLPIANV